MFQIRDQADNGRFPVYAKAKIRAEAEDTVLTEEFRTGWPDTPHRVIRSSLDAPKTFQGDIDGERYLRSANVWSPVALPPRCGGECSKLPVGGLRAPDVRYLLDLLVLQPL